MRNLACGRVLPDYKSPPAVRPTAPPPEGDSLVEVLKGSGALGAIGNVEQALHFWRDLKRRVVGGWGRLHQRLGGSYTQGFEVLDGEHLLAEDLSELAGGLMRDLFERGRDRWIGHFPFEAGDGLVRNAAGIDEAEVIEIGGDVEGESMRSDAARNVDADGADLARGRPAGR